MEGVHGVHLFTWLHSTIKLSMIFHRLQSVCVITGLDLNFPKLFMIFICFQVSFEYFMAYLLTYKTCPVLIVGGTNEFIKVPGPKIHVFKSQHGHMRTS